MWWISNSGKVDKNVDLNLSPSRTQSSEKLLTDEIPRRISPRSSHSDRLSDTEKSEEDFLQDWVHIPDNISIYSFTLSRNGLTGDPDENSSSSKNTKSKEADENPPDDRPEISRKIHNGDHEESLILSQDNSAPYKSLPKRNRRIFYEIVNNPLGLDVDSRILDSMQNDYFIQELNPKHYTNNHLQGENLTTEIEIEDSDDINDTESEDTLSKDLDKNNLDNQEELDEANYSKHSRSGCLSSSLPHRPNSLDMSSVDIPTSNFSISHELKREYCDVCEKTNEEIDALKRENLALKAALHNNYIASKHSSLGSRFDSFQKIFYALSSVGGFLWNALTEPLIFNHPMLDLCPMQSLPTHNKFNLKFPRSGITTSLILPEIKESVYDYFLGSLLQNITLVEENTKRKPIRFKTSPRLENHFTLDPLNSNDGSRFRRFPSIHYNPQGSRIHKVHIYPNKRQYYQPPKEILKEISETGKQDTQEHGMLSPLTVERILTYPETHSNTSQLSDSSFSDNECDIEKSLNSLNNTKVVDKHCYGSSYNKKFWNEFMEMAFFPPNLPRTRQKHPHYQVNHNQIHEPSCSQSEDNTIDTNSETIGKMLIDFEAYRQHLAHHSLDNNKLNIVPTQEIKKDDDREQNTLLLGSLSTHTPPQSNDVVESNTTCLLTSIFPKNEVPSDITVKQY